MRYRGVAPFEAGKMANLCLPFWAWDALEDEKIGKHDLQ